MNEDLGRLARLAAIVLVGTAILCGVSSAQERKKVTIVYSTSNQDVSYQPYGALAQQLGWYRDEGLDVTIQTAANNGLIIQLLLTGQAQFGMLGPDPILLAAAEKPVPLKSVYTIIRKMVFAGVVQPDSPIKSFADMKGKSIGLPSLSSQLIPFVNSRLSEVGLSEKDVKLVDVGYGVASMEALKNGTIDMFVAWPGLFAAFENAGYKFKVLPDAPWQNDYYGIGLAATNDYIAQNPDVVEKIGRGLAKSTVLLQANPDFMIEPFWKAYPTKAPLPIDDRQKAFANERNILKATAKQMRVDELPRTFAWGSQERAVWERHLQRLKDTKLVPQSATVNVDDYFTDAFSAKYNAFDRDAIAKMK
ncbi:MAG: ABC transporter substrate-binding protein [Rhizobiales bacterium]|nr:ABC transporter substrate-binding protein [Hyphomicrobiales bacterium]